MIVNEEVREKFLSIEESLLEHVFVTQGEKFISCKNDSWGCIVNPGEMSHVTCMICKTYICCKCCNAHNGTMSCQDYINSNLDIAGQEALVNQYIDNTFNFQKCPECGLIVERISNCPHMTCVSQKCKNLAVRTNFCIYCGKNINNEVSSHFNQCPKRP